MAIFAVVDEQCRDADVGSELELSRTRDAALRTTVINALAPHAGACLDPATSATAQQTNQPLPIIATTLL
jgi:hypothetical protein